MQATITEVLQEEVAKHAADIHESDEQNQSCNNQSEQSTVTEDSSQHLAQANLFSLRFLILYDALLHQHVQTCVAEHCQDGTDNGGPHHARAGENRHASFVRNVNDQWQHGGDNDVGEVRASGAPCRQVGTIFSVGGNH